MVERAKSSGTGRVMLGGERMSAEFADGYYLRPTVLADVDPRSEIAHQKVFGPVLVIQRFKDEAESNSTGYGLGVMSRLTILRGPTALRRR